MPESQPVGPFRPHGERPISRRLRRARIALYVYFFITGSVISIWASRIPAVKRQTGVDEAELSIALFALALGGVLTIRLMGGLLDRFDGRTVVPATALATSAALVAPGYATDQEQLVLSLLLLGSSHALLNVSANLQAARLQREWGRPIMVSFHAVCSIGGGLGAIAGTLCVRAGLEVTTTLIGAASLLAFLSLAVRKWLTDHPLPPVQSTRTPVRLRRLSLPRGRIVLLGVLALCCMLAEGAANDWSALYTRETVGGSETVAAATYAAYATMMAAGRLVGDRLVALAGPVTVVRTGGLLASAGLFLALAVPLQIPVVLGFALVGVGLSGIVPQLFNAAANDNPARSGRDLSTVAAIGYFGPLLGPPAIGFLADHTGLSGALLLPAFLVLLIPLGAGTLRSPAGERPGSVRRSAAPRRRLGGGMRLWVPPLRSPSETVNGHRDGQPEETLPNNNHDSGNEHR